VYCFQNIARWKRLQGARRYVLILLLLLLLLNAAAAAACMHAVLTG